MSTKPFESRERERERERERGRARPCVRCCDVTLLRRRS